MLTCLSGAGEGLDTGELRHNETEEQMDIRPLVPILWIWLSTETSPDLSDICLVIGFGILAGRAFLRLRSWWIARKVTQAAN